MCLFIITKCRHEAERAIDTCVCVRRTTIFIALLITDLNGIIFDVTHTRARSCGGTSKII
jgi:hypothetical protein